MSSPNLNNVIITGSIVIYSWVAVSGIDNTLVSDWLFFLACQVSLCYEMKIEIGKKL